MTEMNQYDGAALLYMNWKDTTTTHFDCLRRRRCHFILELLDSSFRGTVLQSRHHTVTLDSSRCCFKYVEVSSLSAVYVTSQWRKSPFTTSSLLPLQES